jgi:hypothetical protein
VTGKLLNTFIANQYQQLFMSTAGTHTEEALDCVQTKVTQNMNESLAAPFSREEVWVALKDMGELKAPGGGWHAGVVLQKVLVASG